MRRKLVLGVITAIRVLLPFVLLGVRVSALLMANTLSAMRPGFQNAMRKVPEDLVQQAFLRGVASEYFDRIRLIGRVMTFLTLLAGWILLAHVTVWLVRFIVF